KLQKRNNHKDIQSMGGKPGISINIWALCRDNHQLRQRLFAERNFQTIYNGSRPLGDQIDFFNLLQRDRASDIFS
ncbi:11160_t:CDS:2, partial [Funneliformis mosseae]